MMILFVLLFAAVQDDETAHRAVVEFEAKLQKLHEKERIVATREFFSALKDPTTKCEAIGMIDSRFVTVIPGSIRVELLRPLLKDADAVVRVRAAGAVAYTQTGGDLADELAALLGEKSAEAKAAALRAMGSSGSPAFGAALRGHLASEDVVVRRAAVRAYGEWSMVQSAALVPLLKDKDGEVRSIAAEQLGRSGYPWAGGELARLLDDPEPRVRVTAIRALMMLRQHPELIRLRLADAEATVRVSAAMALGTMDARDHIDAVAALLSSTDRSVRSSAMVALALFHDGSILRRLAPLLADPDEAFRTQVREQLRSWAGACDADVVRREIEAVVLRLGSDDAEERDRAQRLLIGVGWRALEPLKAAAGNAELVARAKATSDEIRWGEATRTLAKKLVEANSSAVRRFELADTTSALSKRWFPEVRVMTLRCTWQQEELSKIAWPKSWLLDPCRDHPVEGAAGVNTMLERYAVKVESTEDARSFIAFMGALGIPDGVPTNNTLTVTKTDSGFEGRRDFGKSADVYTLRVEKGQLRGVTFEHK